MKISTILAENASDFATNVLPVLRYVLFGIIVLCAIVMIITTLMQSNDTDGSLDALSGTSNKQESYYSQNKGASRDSILKRITIAMAVVIFVCVLAFFISELIAGVGKDDTTTMIRCLIGA